MNRWLRVQQVGAVLSVLVGILACAGAALLLHGWLHAWVLSFYHRHALTADPSGLLLVLDLLLVNGWLGYVGLIGGLYWKTWHLPADALVIEIELTIAEPPAAGESEGD